MSVLRSSHILVNTTPDFSPNSQLPYSSLRRPWFAVRANVKASREEACAFSEGGLAVTTATAVQTNTRAKRDWLRVASTRQSSQSALRYAKGVRGGCTARGEASRIRRERRQLRRFISPALVWVVAIATDFNLWARQAPISIASRACRRGNDTKSAGFAWGRVFESVVAYSGHFVCFHVLLGLALLSHIVVTVSDPGFLPRGNITLGGAHEGGRWCERCEQPKPPRAHHCERCGRCVARMDHHCSFVANCVGAGNHKQMLLLLLYAAVCAAHATYLYFGTFRRSSPDGKGFFNIGKELPTWRALDDGLWPTVTVLVFVWLAVLLAVQLYGIAVDAGIVDRLQVAALDHRNAEKNGIPKATAMEPLRREQWLECPPGAVRPCRAKQIFRPPLFPDRNRGTGFGAIRYSAGENQPTEHAYRPATTAAAGAFPTVDLAPPRDPGWMADCDGGDGAIGRGFQLYRELWRSMSEEILGEGPWLLWLVPTAARLSPEAQERVYSTHGLAKRL